MIQKTIDYRKIVEIKVKETIGYREVENKESFMTGVSVAISKLEEIYKSRIKELELSLKYEKENSGIYKKDLTTIASIIDRYSDRFE